jgi:hypothetical protein
MSATATRQAAQAVNRSIPGINDAPDEFPASLAGARLPMALTYLGPGVTRWETHGGTQIRRERTLIIRVYVAEATLGRGITQGIEAAEALLDAAIRVWEVTDELSNGAQVQITEAGNAVVGIGIRDSGVVHDMTYSDAQQFFRGFELQLTVWEWDEDEAGV